MIPPAIRADKLKWVDDVSRCEFLVVRRVSAQEWRKLLAGRLLFCRGKKAKDEMAETVLIDAGNKPVEIKMIDSAMAFCEQAGAPANRIVCSHKRARALRALAKEVPVDLRGNAIMKAGIWAEVVAAPDYDDDVVEFYCDATMVCKIHNLA
jgi:hypothetical protein